MWAALSACSPEQVAPKGDNESPEIALHGYSTPWCAPPTTYNLIDESGNYSPSSTSPAYGELAVANHTDSIRFMLTLSEGWFVDKMSIFAGNSSDIPLSQNGIIETAMMPMQGNPVQLVNNWTYSMQVPNNSQCYDVVYWCEIVQVDFFNGPIQSTRRALWAQQTSFANGYMVDYCYTACSLLQGEDHESE